MGRYVSGTLASIFSPPFRDLDWTVDLVFPSYSYHFASSPLTSVNGFNYTNELEDVGDIRQTDESPTDQVKIAIQNKDRVLGQHVATYWQLWRQATAVVGRYYYQMSAGSRTGVNTWVQMFQGAVQQPNADDFQVTFNLIPDTVSPGQIVCQRSESPICPAVFKDAATCGYSGGLTTCNHLLRSPDGCDGRANSHHFMGFEHRYNPDTTPPGGGDGGPIDPPDHLPCPRLDQFTRVLGPDGRWMPKMVCFVTDDDFIWNPKRNRFYKVKRTEIVKNQPMWELVTRFGAVGYSSAPHPVIQDLFDDKGTAIGSMKPGQKVLGVAEDLVDTRAILVRDTGELGDVLRIEMDCETEEEKIYCWGDDPAKLIACHNSKPPPDL